MPPRKPSIDRQQLYLPNLSRWNWSKLSSPEVAERLRLACASRDTLRRWIDDLEAQRSQARERVWLGLQDAKLTEHTKLGWRPAGMTELEEMGRQQAQLERLLAQVEEAIGRIEERLTRD